MHNLLVIIAVDYDSAAIKGVVPILSQYDENGFFSNVILMSPYMRYDRVIKISQRVEFREIGWMRNIFISKIIAPIHLLRFIWLACKQIKKNKIDLIRATEPSLCGLLAWLISRLSGIPYCISLHADYDLLYKLNGPQGAPTILKSRKLIYPLECYTLRNAKCILPIRKSLMGYLKKRGVASKAIHIFPHGINLESFQKKSDIDIRKKFNLSDDCKIVTFVGRLSSENYLDDMLLAVRRISEMQKNVVFVMAGGGALENYVAKRIEEDEVLNKSTKMVGYVNAEIVCALRQQCDISLCLMGGFSLIEACAGGRPVVAYDVEWHSELIITGETGYLIKENDISGVVDAMNALMNNPLQADLMGRRAKQLVFKTHNIEETTKIKQLHYSEIYRMIG